MEENKESLLTFQTLILFDKSTQNIIKRLK